MIPQVKRSDKIRGILSKVLTKNYKQGKGIMGKGLTIRKKSSIKTI